MKKLLLSTTICLLLATATAYAQQKWNLVTYNVSFKIKNAGIAVNGRFADLKTELIFSPDKLSTSKLSGTVEAITLKTGVNMRDKHIKDETYLDVEKNKLLEISSVKLYTKGAQYAGMFKVTIKGVTKEVEIPFDFLQLGDLADFNGTFTINRRDFNVGGGSMTMSDNLKVTIKVKAKMDK